MMAVTETCVTPADLAAFLEGNLTGEERDRMVRHLNRCPDCFERYTSTARLLGAIEEEEASASPAAEGGSRSRWQAWLLPLAAAILLFVGGAHLWNVLSGGLPSPGPELSRVFPALPEARRGAFDEDEKIQRIVRDHRGDGPKDMAFQRQAFQLGARWVDLDPALRSQSSALTERALRNLRAILPGAIERRDLPEQPCSRLLAPRAPEPKEIDACRQVIEKVFGDRPEFALGHWTEATRLALATGADRYFTHASVRKFPERLLEVENTSWDPRVRASLERAGKILEDGLSRGEGEALEAVLQDLARFYELGE
jgi:hypothetical protein